jgi:hypothetical protein
MEGFLHDHIMGFMSEHSLISIAQHGFVQIKGCVTNLLEARDILTEAVHTGFAAGIIYTDFAKAFDKVPHKRLLHKLKAYGISDNLHTWLEAWLTGRQQRAVIDKFIISYM